MELTPGTRLGPYEVLSRLGAGGMGEVWKARDTRLGRLVAIKTANEQFSERFEREARAVAALNHPHICILYDVGPDYLVMEYVEGAEIRGPLALGDALRYSVQLAGALEAAHGKGTMHRDLKPANILLCATGVKLLDFGLAKMSVPAAEPDATRLATLTQAGTIMGTAPYMSPEQARGDAIDARSDIFSFGVVLYELLSGRRAFAHDSFIETMSAVLYDDPAPVDAPDDVRALIDRCMRKNPNDRFAGMAEVREALERSIDDRVERPASRAQPSIAVLPFTNMSADKENEYFSDGLAEEILNLLAKTPELRVIARTSSFAFRGKEQDITTIANALRVRYVLEGSVRRAGNRIRVTAQLIQASDGTHLWSERYDRDLTDVFAIQDEIGRAISDALHVRLVPRGRTVGIEAWEHWLKGVHARARNTPDSVLVAKGHFERALAIDPAYAEAHSGLALCHYVMAVMGVRPAAESKALAKEAARRALAIDPSNSDAHVVLALTAGVFDFDWPVADEHHRQARSAGTVSPRAHYTYASTFLVPLGRAEEGVEQSRAALLIDPLSVLFHSGLVWCLYAAGRHEEAIGAAHEALEIDPNFHLNWAHLGFAQLGGGAPRDAVSAFRRALELAPWNAVCEGALAAAMYSAGDVAGAREVAQRFTSASGSGMGQAIYHAATGDAAAMFDALDTAYERRDLYLSAIRSIERFRAYEGDVRYTSLLARMNLGAR